METLHKMLDVDELPAQAAKSETTAGDTIEARRARRMAALQKIAGMWVDRADIPADGLEYQRDLRGTWP
jgi:hypothetical protein